MLFVPFDYALISIAKNHPRIIFLANFHSIFQLALTQKEIRFVCFFFTSASKSFMVCTKWRVLWFLVFDSALTWTYNIQLPYENKKQKGKLFINLTENLKLFAINQLTVVKNMHKLNTFELRRIFTPPKKAKQNKTVQLISFFIIICRAVEYFGWIEKQHHQLSVSRKMFQCDRFFCSLVQIWPIFVPSTIQLCTSCETRCHIQIVMV